jgi:hypothetical protein
VSPSRMGDARDGRYQDSRVAGGCLPLALPTEEQSLQCVSLWLSLALGCPFALRRPEVVLVVLNGFSEQGPIARFRLASRRGRRSCLQPECAAEQKQGGPTKVVPAL